MGSKATIPNTLLPVAFHSLAFFISLFIRSTTNPIAGAWLFFHLAGCALLLYQNDYSEKKGVTWLFTLAWLFAVPVSVFIIRPVFNSANYMWVLISMPSLALCLRPQHLGMYLKAFGGIITVYASNLIIQKALHVHYAVFDYDGRYAWPLIDPNNAAAIVNIAFVPCMFLAIFKDIRWAPLGIVYALAIYATGSKAGYMVDAAMLFAMLSYRFGPKLCLAMLLSGIAVVACAYRYRPEYIVLVVHCFADRLPIWWAGWQMLWVNPWSGLGLGTFGDHYVQQGSILYIPPAFAHNDMLQFAVEMGLPVVIVFAALIVAVAVTTNKRNIVAALALLAGLMQSMVEFQFYLSAVCLPMGLALAYHINTQKKALP